MLSKCSLRLKLSDFINSDIEEEVISKINKINYDLNIVILLYLSNSLRVFPLTLILYETIP